jgi:hypothetical protein
MEVDPDKRTALTLDLLCQGEEYPVPAICSFSVSESCWNQWFFPDTVIRDEDFVPGDRIASARNLLAADGDSYIPSFISNTSPLSPRL